METAHQTATGSYRPASSPIEAWERAGERLRILLVVSSPIDEPVRINAELEIQEIYRQLLWSRVPAALIRLHPPTWRFLQATLHARPFDIVHIIGHARSSKLQLEQEDGSSDWVAAAELAALFQDTRVGLVVLNSCSSERLGDELVRQGVPAVMATTRQLHSETASVLASSLYAALARGTSLKEALEFIRRTLQREPRLPAAQDEVVTLLGPGAEEPLRPALPVGDPEYFPCEPPHNLPAARARSFCDRVHELQRLAALLSSGPSPFIGLIGLAGSGKSTLAIELAHRYSWRFTRGIAYASLRRMRPFDLVGLLAHLDWGLEEASGSRQRGLALYEMGRGPLLLVLDDLEEATPAEVEDLCDLLSAWDTSLGGRALLLMRHRRPEFDQLLQTNWLTVGQLPAQAAYEFVEERLGGKEIARVQLGRRLQELPRLCYYHPKLMTLATSALQLGIPWQELATQLRQLSGKPLQQMEQLLHLTIARVTRESPLASQFLECWPVFSEASSESAWRFIQAGRLPQPGESLWQQQNEALEAIQRAAILERAEGPSGLQCRMHPLVSDYLRLHCWQALSQAKRAEYQRRHLLFCIEVYQSKEGVEAELLFDWDNIALAVERARHLGLWQDLLTLAEALVGERGTPLLKRYQLKQALQILEVALEAAQQLKQSLQEARFLLQRGICRYRLAEYQPAYQDVVASLQLARQSTDAVLISAAELELGRVCYRLTRYDEAEEHFEAVRAQAAARRDLWQEAAAWHELGRLAYRRHQFERAVQLLAEARRLREQLGDQEGLARTLHEQGRLQHELALRSQEPAKLDEAESLYLLSLSLRRQIGDRVGEQATLHQLGLLAFDRGNLSQANAYYAESMQLARELNDRFWIVHNQFRSARLLWYQGQRQEALSQAQEALALCRLLGIGLEREIEEWLRAPA
jgi:hypothetical protein